MYKVTFKFENSEDVTVFAAFGESLLEVARKTNVAIDAPCSGNASCGKCRVKLVEGELDSKQTRHISDEEYAQGWRLACCSKINADVAVMVPDIASAYRSRMKVADLSSPDEVKIFDNIKQSITEAGIELKNNLESIHVKMDVPTLDDTMPDNERLTRAIREITGMQRVKLPYSVIHKMAQVLREHNFDVNVVIRKTEKDIFVYDICGADETPVIAGLAIDIGTTTVSAIIIDMTDGKILAKGSSGNGQIRYGADVINRIIESRKPGGQDKLQKAIIEETINPLVQTMCRQAKINPMNIYRMSVAANTTMNHLLIGVNADPVRMEPYIPTFFKTNSIFAGDIGIKVNPDAHIILAPNIGSYVGGSLQPVTLATIYKDDQMYAYFNVADNQWLEMSMNNQQPTKDLPKKIMVQLGKEGTESYPATLDYLSPNVDLNTGTLMVRANFDNPQGVLKSGLYVSITLPYGEADHAILVKEASIGTDQLGKFLYAVNDSDIVHYRHIEIGQLINDTLRQVLGGLSPQERYVTEALMKVRDGMKIKPIP